MIKTCLLSLFLICSFSIVYSQQKKDTSKTYRNEFGIDATSFFFLYLPLGQDNNYLPNYNLTYRRKFNSGNIRYGLGGNFLNQKVENNNYPNDSNEYNRFNCSIYSRVGWEFFSEISKRWQIYYGLDTKFTYQRYKNDLIYTSNDYAYGSETIYYTLGISPILGFRFKLNKRISLTTETNFSIDWSKSNRRDYYTPVNSSLPPIPDEITPSSIMINGQFSLPISIIFTFDI
jgi:hypothetical protein